MEKRNGKLWSRVLAILMILFMAALALQGCGNKSGNEETKASKTENKDETTKDDEIQTADNKHESENVTGLACPSVNGALQVKGTKLCDEDGNEVQLRGISTHGLAWYPEYVNKEAFTDFHDDWGANVMRLAMYTDEDGGYCNNGDKEALKQLVYDGVEYATEADMYVIVDWHILSDGNPNTNKEDAIDFFSEVSEKLKDNNNVIYEICNEPNNGTTWSDIKAYAYEVIPVIRANDEDAIIIVGTPNWSQYVNEAAADPISGYDNIMYTLHFYAATHKEDLRNTMEQAIDDGLPVFVTEYGICDASGNGNIDIDEANQWVDIMNEYGVSYVAWNLSNKDESSAIFKTSCSKTAGFTEDDLSDEGKWLYDMLKEAADKENAGESNIRTKSGEEEDSNTEEDSDKKADKDNVIRSGAFEITYEITNSWEGDGKTYYQYNLTMVNKTDKTTDGWAVTINFDSKIEFTQGWNGKYTAGGKSVKITNESYNGEIASGDTVSDVGFILCSDNDELKVVE